MAKDFKKLDEQLDILRSRGLIIEDEENAKDFLLKNNYYRISEYSLTLSKYPFVDMKYYGFNSDWKSLL